MLKTILIIVLLGLLIYFAAKLIKFVRQKGIGFLKYVLYLIPMISPFLRIIKWRWLLVILKRFLQKP